MSENTSWLKKPDVMPLRQTMGLQNLAEVNSTLTMQEFQSETILKPPKRKSCMLRKGQNMILLSSEGKKRQSMAPPKTNSTAFKERTHIMVNGRRSIVPPAKRATAPLRQTTAVPKNIATNLTRPIRKLSIQSTPLHMSTPCEVPRSILKNLAMAAKPTSAVKKVNFDNASEEEYALEESTIHTFPILNFPKVTLTTADASTNTDSSQSLNSDFSIADLKSLLDSLGRNVIEKLASLEAKIDMIEKSNSCPCKSPLVAENTLKFSKFTMNLDDIREVSENATPSSEQSSRTVTPGVANLETVQEMSENVTSSKDVTDSVVTDMDQQISVDVVHSNDDGDGHIKTDMDGQTGQDVGLSTDNGNGHLVTDCNIEEAGHDEHKSSNIDPHVKGTATVPEEVVPPTISSVDKITVAVENAPPLPPTPPESQEELISEVNIKQNCNASLAESEKQTENQSFGNEIKVAVRRTRRAQQPLHDDSSAPAMNLRVTRKRGIPKYLQSFMLSPRPKVCQTPK